MTRYETLAFLIAAAAAIFGALTGLDWLHWIGKPLATGLLLAAVLRRGEGSYGNMIAAGLVFSLLGDVFLMIPRDLFLAGLISFFIAHLCYIRAFVLGVGLTRDWPVILIFLLVAVAIIVLLWSGVPGAMRIPVIAYALVLGTMAVQAFGRASITRLRADQIAATGAIAFMASDTILAVNKFLGPVPLAPVWVLSTYWLAQYLIATAATSSASVRSQ